MGQNFISFLSTAFYEDSSIRLWISNSLYLISLTIWKYSKVKDIAETLTIINPVNSINGKRP